MFFVTYCSSWSLRQDEIKEEEFADWHSIGIIKSQVVEHSPKEPQNCLSKSSLSSKLMIEKCSSRCVWQWNSGVHWPKTGNRALTPITALSQPAASNVRNHWYKLEISYRYIQVRTYLKCGSFSQTSSKFFILVLLFFKNLLKLKAPGLPTHQSKKIFKIFKRSGTRWIVN